LERLDDTEIHNGLKVQPPAAMKGHFPKDRFDIDLDKQTVTCPAGVTVSIRGHGGRHAGVATFGAACATCPLAAQCTTAKTGLSIAISPHEVALQAGRARHNDPAWRADYRATHPKVDKRQQLRTRRADLCERVHLRTDRAKETGDHPDPRSGGCHGFELFVLGRTPLFRAIATTAKGTA
jgi:hypothetical protein